MDRWLNKIINAGCLEALRQIPDKSIHCCVTSPPYWGLRDYGVPGQLGLEKTPEEYTAKMVEIFREVRRVLRDDGTLWLNLGDSYAGSGCGTNDYRTEASRSINKSDKMYCKKPPQQKIVSGDIKAKDLLGIPWRVAFALQADGWYLRQDIIWHKPNTMPESVTDRPTKAHEYIFLLSKSAKYYYDSEAVKEEALHPTVRHKSTRKTNAQEAAFLGNAPTNLGRCGTAEDGMRNRRSVWTVATHPYKEAHFATFPPDLIKPCIKAGCPEEGIVIDPFMGSGTTAEVCCNLNRQFIGIELNPEYCKLAEARIARATAQMRLFHG